MCKTWQHCVHVSYKTQVKSPRDYLRNLSGTSNSMYEYLWLWVMLHKLPSWQHPTLGHKAEQHLLPCALSEAVLRTGSHPPPPHLLLGEHGKMSYNCTNYKCERQTERRRHEMGICDGSLFISFIAL